MIHLPLVFYFIIYSCAGIGEVQLNVMYNHYCNTCLVGLKDFTLHLAHCRHFQLQSDTVTELNQILTKVNLLLVVILRGRPSFHSALYEKRLIHAYSLFELLYSTGKYKEG